MPVDEAGVPPAAPVPDGIVDGATAPFDGQLVLPAPRPTLAAPAPTPGDYARDGGWDDARVAPGDRR